MRPIPLAADKAPPGNQSAGTNHERVRIAQALLTFHAELGEQDVPTVAKQLIIIHSSAILARARVIGRYNARPHAFT
jgi:hypothetical protein